MVAHPKTKEESLRQLRSIWLAYLATVPLYVYAVQLMSGPSWLHFRNAVEVFSILSAFDLISFVWFWQKRHSRAVETLRSNPEDVHAIRRWVASVTILLALAESHAVFGAILGLGGTTLEESSPFFIVTVILMLLLWPRKVWESQDGNIIHNRPTQ